MNMSEILTKKFSDDEKLLLSKSNNPSRANNTRKDESELQDEERENFINAVGNLISSGRYNQIVNIHADMTHDMHGRNMITGEESETGVQRFLAWHRAYLLEFEKLLQLSHPEITIPYWNWTKNQSFPKWLSDFTPSDLINRDNQSYNVSRDIGKNSPLPTPDDIKHGMQMSMTYTDFTLFLEGWYPYGAHNQVHMYIGDTMTTMYSPADPVFWLHHAECDRLWHIWQLSHATEHASLYGKSAIMDPWQYRYKDLTNIKDLNYRYQRIKIG